MTRCQWGSRAPDFMIRPAPGREFILIHNRERWMCQYRISCSELTVEFPSLHPFQSEEIAQYGLRWQVDIANLLQLLEDAEVFCRLASD